LGFKQQLSRKFLLKKLHDRALPPLIGVLKYIEKYPESEACAIRVQHKFQSFLYLEPLKTLMFHICTWESQMGIRSLFFGPGPPALQGTFAENKLGCNFGERFVVADDESLGALTVLHSDYCRASQRIRQRIFGRLPAHTAAQILEIPGRSLVTDPSTKG
jgi:hypothetical protein